MTGLRITIPDSSPSRCRLAARAASRARSCATRAAARPPCHGRAGTSLSEQLACSQFSGPCRTRWSTAADRTQTFADGSTKHGGRRGDPSRRRGRERLVVLVGRRQPRAGGDRAGRGRRRPRSRGAPRRRKPGPDPGHGARAHARRGRGISSAAGGPTPPCCRRRRPSATSSGRRRRRCPQFDQEVLPVAGGSQVIDSNGEKVTDGAAHTSQTDVKTLVIPLQADLPKGDYTVRWGIVATDGHLESGVFAFGVGTGRPPPQAASSRAATRTGSTCWPAPPTSPACCVLIGGVVFRCRVRAGAGSEPAEAPADDVASRAASRQPGARRVGGHDAGRRMGRADDSRAPTSPASASGRRSTTGGPSPRRSTPPASAASSAAASTSPRCSP